MTKPPSRLKNRGGGFMWTRDWINLSYDKFVCDFNLTYDKW